MIQIPLFKVYMHPYVDQSLLKVIHSGYIGQGPKVEEFEKLLSTRIGNPYCLTLSAGTHGLQLALRNFEVSYGDEVITTPLSCTATAWPILMQGANIVWVDIQSESLNIDPDKIRKKITNKTKAIICVHWGGYPCDMKELRDISIEYNIPIIEDAAHAFGSTYKDSIIGDCSYSASTMFSFQAIKTLTSVDGGCLFVTTKEYYKKIKLLRWYGIDREGLRRDMRCEDPIEYWGYKAHMNDICATIGIKNLEKVDALLSIMKDNVDYYRKELTGFSGITMLQNQQDRKSSNWLFTVLVDDRTSFASMMGECGIHVSRVHERIDKHPCVSQFQCELPVLESIMPNYVAWPCGWWVTKDDREYIVSCIKKGW